MNAADKRTHPRSQYFLVKDAGQPIPIYAFRNAADVSAIPALVVDLGDGGVQVLTAQTTELTDRVYNLELVLESPANDGLEHAKIHKVWSREDGVNVRTGFAFAPGADVSEKWAPILTSAPHHLVRCVLHPL